MLGVIVSLLAARAMTHGYAASWDMKLAGGWTHITDTVEHRVRFPSEHRPLARYVEHWPFAKAPLPPDVPEFRATLRGAVTLDRASRLRVRATPDATLTVDDAPADDRVFAPAAHEVTIVWSGRFDSRTRLTLERAGSADPGTSWRAVAAHAITPPPGAQSRGAMWLALLAIAALTLAFAFALGRALGSPEARLRKRRLAHVALAALLLLGLGLRLFDYGVMPGFRENGDERFAEWNGYSLLTEGTTRGWTLWPGRYRGTAHIEQREIFGQRWFVVTPYFEHPPLLHLLVGAAALLGGAENFVQPRLTDTRLVPIALFVPTLLLLYALGRRLLPRGRGALLACLLYATLPVLVLQGRVIKEEALLVPLLLGGLLFFVRWRDGGRRRRDLVWAGLLVGLCTAAKLTGAVFAIALVLMVLRYGDLRDTLVAAAAASIGPLLVLLYGAALGWHAFWLATSIQATGRPTHFNIFPRFFDDSLVNHNLVGRGQLLFLWLAYVAAALRDRRTLDPAWTLPPLLYLIGIAISSGNWTFGWYFLPLYPFLCLGAGSFLDALWREPGLLRGLLFVTLPLMYAMNFVVGVGWAKTPANWPELRLPVTLFALAFLAPYVLREALRGPLIKRWAQATTAVGLALLVCLSSYFVVHYDTLFDTHHDFDRDAYFDR